MLHESEDFGDSEKRWGASSPIWDFDRDGEEDAEINAEEPHIW